MANSWKSKIFIVLLGIIVAITLYLRNSSGDIVEPFWNGIPLSVNKELVARNDCGQEVAIPNQYYSKLPESLFTPQGLYTNENNVTTFESQANPGSTFYLPSAGVQENFTGNTEQPDNFYTVPGQYQAMLSPRMFSGDYGANITYNMPEYKNQAVPYTPNLGNSTPLDQWNQVESFDYKPGSSSYNYEQVEHGKLGGAVPTATIESEIPIDFHSGLPVGQMGQGGPQQLAAANFRGRNKGHKHKGCNPENVHIYERLIFANMKRRGYGDGDYIRGDLAPVQNECSGWFITASSKTPKQSLNTGALMAIAGPSNATAMQTLEFVNTNGTAGAINTGAGGTNSLTPEATNYIAAQARKTNNINMSAQYSANLAQLPGGSIMTASFPEGLAQGTSFGNVAGGQPQRTTLVDATAFP